MNILALARQLVDAQKGKGRGFVLLFINTFGSTISNFFASLISVPNTFLHMTA